MKKIFIFLLLFSFKGFSQDVTSGEERPLGLIYSSNTWANLNGFTQNGGTWTTSGGKILCSTGAGTYTQSLDLSSYGLTCMHNWHMYLRSSVASITGSSYGIGIGIRSYNQYPGGITNAVARIAMYTGAPGQSFLSLGTTNATANLSSTSIPLSANDLVEQTVDFDGFYIKTTIRNVTQNSAPITIDYLFQTVTGNDPFMPNTGMFSIFALGGSLKIDSFAVSSNTPVNSALAIGGDSKVAGYEVSTQGYTICNQVGKYVKSCLNLGGGFDRTAELSARVPEIIKLHPKVFLNLIGSNDVRSGVSAAVYEARYDSINNALIAAGIRVLTGVLYESSVNMAPLQAYIIAHYPAANFIDLYDQMNISGTLASGNVHPNNYGDSVASNTIIQFFGFYNQTPRYFPDQGSAYNWTGPHTFNVQPGNIALNNTSFGTITNNIQAGTFGLQSVVTNNGFLQENLYFNGSASTYLTTGFGDVVQFNNGDIDFETAVSGSAGASATLHTYMRIENNGIILTGTSTDHGFGNLQVNGTQGIAQYYDATHFATFASNATGDGLISSVSKLYSLGGVSASAEFNFGTNLTHAAWGLTGIKLVGLQSTFTDNSSSGTVTNAAINTFLADTLNATNNSVTYTNAYELYIPSGPQLPSNNSQTVAITHPYALGLGGPFNIITTTTPQFNLAYDATHSTTFSTGSSGIYTVTPTGTEMILAGHFVPNNNVTYDLGTSSLAWRDIYFSHTIGESAMGTSNSLGTNITSATASGSDEDFQLTIVVGAGGGAGTICDMTFGRTWISRPHCTISDANTTTIALTTNIAANATTTSNFEVAGTIATGTATYNCHCGQ